MSLMNYDLEGIVRQISTQNRWSYNFVNGEYLIEIPTQAGRTQVVRLMTGNDPDGVPLLFIWSPVGPATLAQRHATWLLAYNTELSYGACAIYNDMLVIKDSQILGTADLEELVRITFNVARVADGLEAEMMGAYVDQA